MKIVFLIDKAQTVQSIAGALIEATKRGHECTVLATCSSGQAALLTDMGLDAAKLTWINLKDRYEVVSTYERYKTMYDVTVGINMFNDLMRSVFVGAGRNVVSFEHCWNNFYNFKRGFDSESRLFANSDWTAKNLRELSNYKHIECVGSQWFELIKRFRDESEDYIVFAGPPNRFQGRKTSSSTNVRIFLPLLRDYCDKRGLRLILKTRTKFGEDFSNIITFDKTISDGNAFDHLQLYAKARCVLHFCSSAVNEVSFLDVPHVCLLPDIHVVLHDHKPDTYAGMQRINAQYYDNEIVDGIHCASLRMDELTEFGDRYDIIDRLIDGKHDWRSLQSTFFPGDHDGAAKRVLEAIENA